MFQDCIQLGEPLLGRILAPETCRSFELGNARIECAVLMMQRGNSFAFHGIAPEDALGDSAERDLRIVEGVNG